MILPTLKIVTESGQEFMPLILKNCHLIYEDEWQRKWKLEPVKNENIIMPFIVTPLLPSSSI